MNAWRSRLDGHAQLINLINGPSHDENGRPGQPSEGEFLRYLNLGFHLAPTADQDNHLENWGSAARTRTGVWARSLSKADVLTALRERRAYATEDQNLRIIGMVNGSLMGTRFRGTTVPAPGTPLSITVDCADIDEPSAEYTIDIFRDTVGGTPVADVVRQHTHTGNGTLTISDITYSGGEQYFFLKITQHDEGGQDDRAWLAPVWFEPTGTPDPTPSPDPDPTPDPDPKPGPTTGAAPARR